MASPTRRQAEVREAARLAQIDDFIMTLPQGYDALVGERGLKLSGGEKQRVAIARTILKAPPILMLDEATSALDSHTEQDIQDALDGWRASARPWSSPIGCRPWSHADDIIVLEHGEIVEQGTHRELLAKGGALCEPVEPPARGRRGARAAGQVLDEDEPRQSRAAERLEDEALAST